MKKTPYMLVLVLLIPPASAVELHVPSDYATIQQALDDASLWDTSEQIIVEPNIYHENISVPRYFVGTIRCVSPEDPCVVASTIINGSGLGPVITFEGTYYGATLSGFTITGGYNSDSGGGIVGNNTPATISHCIITNNHTDLSGGGLYSCNGFIINCTISNNYAGNRGGGMAECFAVIDNCLVADNTSDQSATGLDNCDGTINNCTIVDNHGSALRDCGGSITSCIIWGNSGLAIEDCCTPSYSCFPGASGANGNLDTDPGFLDPCANDYHLTAGSPCINAGRPDYFPLSGRYDLDREPRVMGGRVDIGVDEAPMPITSMPVPTEGEVWAGGSSHAIEWSPAGSSPTVDIEYSLDLGVSWKRLRSGLANSGTYAWDIPGPADLDQCELRVVPTSDPNYLEYYRSGTFALRPASYDPPVQSSWPTLGGDFSRSGLAAENGPLSACYQWSYSPGIPLATGIAIGANDRVHLTCRDGSLHTLDPNGQLLWTYETGSEIMTVPSVGLDGTVYVGCLNGRLHAVDIDGDVRWTHTTESFVHATPAIATDGSIYLGSQDGQLYALTGNGTPRWTFATQGLGEIPGAIVAPPTLGADGAVYVGGAYDSLLYALDPCDGSVIWSHDFTHPIDPCDPNGPRTAGNFYAAPVVGSNGTTYTCLLNDTRLYALDPNDGQLIWSVELADYASPPFEPNHLPDHYYHDPYPAVEPVLGPDGTIYVTFDDPYLRAVSPDGSIKWVATLADPGDFTLTVDHAGRVYAAGHGAGLYVLGSDGRLISRRDLGDYLPVDEPTGQHLSRPVIANDGIIYVLDFAADTIWCLSTAACESQSLWLYRVADLNRDKAVDAIDVGLLAGDWLQGNSLPFYLIGDINRDAHVDLADFAAVSIDWLQTE